jgi:hypothetical protein
MKNDQSAGSFGDSLQGKSPVVEDNVAGPEAGFSLRQEFSPDSEIFLKVYLKELIHHSPRRTQENLCSIF